MSATIKGIEDRLWALADAVTPKRWTAFISRHSNTFCIHDRRQREVIAWTGFDGSDTAETRQQRARLCAFMAAADPETTKKLIAKNRRLREALAKAEQALAVCRQSLTEQASARFDPDMPILTAEVREGLREKAEAAYALAEDRQERVEAHGLSLLVAWQDRPTPSKET